MNNDFLLLEPSQSEIFRIGRKSDCNLVLEDRYVSREHASIRFENNLWILKNLSQSSGTFCNNLSIDEKTLEDGDILSLGTQKISISIKNKTLQILLIKNNESAPLVFSKNEITIGRKTEIPEAQILSSACPAYLAQVKKEESGYSIKFNNKIFNENKKTKSSFILNENEKINLPWCSLECKDSFLFVHKQTPGFSVEAKNLNVRVDKKQLLKSVDFYLPRGEILAVIGRSGQGKSTLLRLLLGKHKIENDSTLLLNGISYKNEKIRKYIAFLEQEPELRKDLTVQETLELAASITLPKDTTEQEIQDILDNFLELLSLKHLAKSKTASLSGGEARRVALAKELIGSPGLILLDEPLAGLDPVNIKILCYHLRRLSLLGYTIILTTHGYEALEIANKVLVLHKGREAFFGTPEETFLYFDTTSPAKALQSLKESSLEKWEQSSLKERIFPEASEKQKFLFPKIKHSVSCFSYFKILCRQYFRDKGKIFALLLQPLIIGFLFSQTFSKNSSLWIAAFALILSANWFALSLSIREIIQEKNLFSSEIRKGVSPFGILFAKLFFISSIAFFQTLICFGFLNAVLSIAVSPLWLCVAFLSTILPATLLGLLASCLVKNTSQANILLPLLIIPQVILGGALVPIDQMTTIGRMLSALIPAKYNLDCLKNLFLNVSIHSHDLIIPIILACIFYIITWRLFSILGKAK